MKPFSQADFYKSCSLATVTLIKNLVSDIEADKYCREVEIAKVREILGEWRERLAADLNPVGVGEDVSDSKWETCPRCLGDGNLMLGCRACSSTGVILGVASPEGRIKTIVVNGVNLEIMESMVSYDQIVELALGSSDRKYEVKFSPCENKQGHGILIEGYALAAKEGMDFTVELV